MLNFDLQLEILKSLMPTYVGERRVEITSTQFNVDHDVFILNVTYLKKEKLIDLSSLSSRSAIISAIDSDEPENIKNTAAEVFAIARCNITHLGVKALHKELGPKLISA